MIDITIEMELEAMLQQNAECYFIDGRKIPPSVTVICHSKPIQTSVPDVKIKVFKVIKITAITEYPSTDHCCLI